MEWAFVVIVGLILFAPEEDTSTASATLICLASQCTLQTSEVREDQVLNDSTSELDMGSESKDSYE